MEVSSIARSLAHSICEQLILSKSIKDIDTAYEIETTAATCGLIHDVGNPPFGHAGEEAIRNWFKKRPNAFWDFDKTPKNIFKNDLINFEGNAQTIRLIATLQILSDRSGLNLTIATLSAVSKYTADSIQIGQNGQSKKKLGYFNSEKEVIAKVRERTGTGTHRNPITFLVEASDDIAYSVVDIEDGIKKGVISWDQVRTILHANIDKIGANIFRDTVLKAEERIESADIPLAGRTKDEAISQYFRTLVIGVATESVKNVFLQSYNEIMGGHYDQELLYDTRCNVCELYKILKLEIGLKHVYTSKETLRLEILGCNVIHDLMDIFWNCDHLAKPKSFERKTYNLLSQNYKTVFEHPTNHEKTLPTEYRKALLITDYICGMTDSFALNLHRELRNG